MRSRRSFLVASSAAVGATLSGCLNETDDNEPSATDGRTQSPDGSEQPAAGLDGSGNSDDGDEESCHFEDRTRTESVVSKTRDIDGGYEWTHGYRAEAGDRVTFDISASDGQDIDVEIDSPSGSTIYRETGFSIRTEHLLTSGGQGEIRVLNMGDRTREEREELWSDIRNADAGQSIVLRATFQAGDSIDYRARLVDGARPKIRVETANGATVRDHAVSEVIDDSYTFPEDGEYYIYIENTATFTGATWDYEVDLVREIPVSSSVTIDVDREYEEQTEVCN